MSLSSLLLVKSSFTTKLDKTKRYGLCAVGCLLGFGANHETVESEDKDLVMETLAERADGM
jgi:hypothetical protein